VLLIWFDGSVLESKKLRANPADQINWGGVLLSLRKSHLTARLPLAGFDPLDHHVTRFTFVGFPHG
jgi:hypothetical protein